MSTAESEFHFLTEADLKDVPAPTADRFVDPAERVESFAYACGYVELRSAVPGEWINTDKPVHTNDFR